MIASASAMQAVTPATRPSMPSSRLIAFVMATIHSTEAGRESQPSSKGAPKGLLKVVIWNPQPPRRRRQLPGAGRSAARAAHGAGHALAA